MSLDLVKSKVKQRLQYLASSPTSAPLLHTHTYSPMEAVQSYPEERSLFGVLTQVSTKSIPLCVSLAIVLFILLGVKTYMRLPKKLRDTAT